MVFSYKNTSILILLFLPIIPLYALAEVENSSTQIMQEQSWKQGDVLISSATIFAFFAFGSFVTIRFQSRYKEDLVKLVGYTFIFILIIEIIQIYIITSIVKNQFNSSIYEALMYSTLTLFGLMLLFIHEIIAVENRIERVDPLIREFLTDFVSGVEQHK